MLETLLCLVVAITDGDTLKVRCGQEGAYEQVTIRLAEIDSPERKQSFGNRSKDALGALCHEAIATIKPQTKDRYGRTVARVECKGVGLHQVPKRPEVSAIGAASTGAARWLMG